MEDFRAKTQYNDWVGTVAADISEHSSLFDLLQKKHLLRDGEQIVAVNLYVVGTESDRPARIIVDTYLADKDNYHDIVNEEPSGPKFKVRVVRFGFDIDRFVKFFKRFNLVLTEELYDLDADRIHIVEEFDATEAIDAL